MSSFPPDDEVPNLDDYPTALKFQDYEEREVARHYQISRAEAAALISYAGQKVDAYNFRIDGDIRNATRIENDLDRRYKALPAKLRW